MTLDWITISTRSNNFWSSFPDTETSNSIYSIYYLRMSFNWVDWSLSILKIPASNQNGTTLLVRI